eukprot:8785775-Pyramimonas_sp.AAC.1
MRGRSTDGISRLSAKSTESISPIQNAPRATAIATGEASRPGEAQGNPNAYPNTPVEWVGMHVTAPTLIALNGQFGQDSDDPIDKDHDIYSMGENFD